MSDLEIDKFLRELADEQLALPEMGDRTCVSCLGDYRVRPDSDDTGWCDLCAQAKVGEMARIAQEVLDERTLARANSVSLTRATEKIQQLELRLTEATRALEEAAGVIDKLEGGTT